MNPAVRALIDEWGGGEVSVEALDSLQLLELRVTVEDVIGREVPPELLDSWTCLDDAVAFVEDAL